MSSFLLAIAITSIISFIVMSLWYSPLLFGNIWMKAAGIKPDPSAMKGMRKLFGAQFIYCIITTRVIFTILRLSPSQNLGSLLTLMFAVRVGLPLMGGLGTMLREQKSWKYVAVNTGATLVQLLITAVIFSLIM